MTIGDRIRELREEHGITQEELAKHIQSTKQTIYKYENNIITNIPSDKVLILANALHTSPAYLMGWNTDKKTYIINKPEIYLTEESSNYDYSEIIELLRQMNDDGISKVKDYITDLLANRMYRINN
jgi:transcriptional regulator with XRE-family HTH domain